MQAAATRLNRMKNRMLMLSPAVEIGVERELNSADYSVVRDLGKGSFGRVLQIQMKANRREYALKEIDKSLIKKTGMERQVMNEIRIMYSLDHDNIIKLFNHFEDEKSCFLVMEFANGGQLYQKMLKIPSGKFDEKSAVQVVFQLCQALKYLHANNIIHRDIKPENILLDADGNIKLADFGWSNYADIKNKRNTYCGTLDYLAPEMADHIHQHDYRVDIWSVGVLIYELLAGYAPFSPKKPMDDEEQMEKQIKQNIISSQFSFPATFPPLAKDLVKKILVNNPEQRYSLDQILSHSWILQNNRESPIKKPSKSFAFAPTADFLEFVKRKANPREVQEDPSYFKADYTFTTEDILKFIRPECVFGLAGAGAGSQSPTRQTGINNPYLNAVPKIEGGPNPFLKVNLNLKKQEEVKHKVDGSGVSQDSTESFASTSKTPGDIEDILLELTRAKTEAIELKKEVARRDAILESNGILRRESEAAQTELTASRKKQDELQAQVASLLAENSALKSRIQSPPPSNDELIQQLAKSNEVLFKTEFLRREFEAVNAENARLKVHLHALTGGSGQMTVTQLEHERQLLAEEARSLLTRLKQAIDSLESAGSPGKGEPKLSSQQPDALRHAYKTLLTSSSLFKAIFK